MAGEGCAVLEIFIPERGDVLIPPLFEVYCTPHVVFLFPLKDLRVVNDILLSTVVFDGALVFFGCLAVTSTSLLLVVLFVDDLVILGFLDLRHVFHATIRDFYGVSVQDGAEWVASRKRVPD